MYYILSFLEEYDKDRLATFVQTINHELRPMQQKIDKVIHEMTGKPSFCFVSDYLFNSTSNGRYFIYEKFF